MREVARPISVLVRALVDGVLELAREWRPDLVVQSQAQHAGLVCAGALLPACAAIVHHGGAGSTMTALDAGVSQLVLPSGADRYVNADAVRERGVGLSAEEHELVVPLLNRLLTDAGLRAEAAAVRAELRAMPAPEVVAAELVEWVRG